MSVLSFEGCAEHAPEHGGLWFGFYAATTGPYRGRVVAIDRRSTGRWTVGQHDLAVQARSPPPLLSSRRLAPSLRLKARWTGGSRPQRGPSCSLASPPLSLLGLASSALCLPWSERTDRPRFLIPWLLLLFDCF